MSEFKQYRKIRTQSMRPYVKGEDMSDISITVTPEKGGMIAIAGNDAADQWYIPPDFFKANYEEA